MKHKTFIFTFLRYKTKRFGVKRHNQLHRCKRKRKSKDNVKVGTWWQNSKQLRRNHFKLQWHWAAIQNSCELSYCLNGTALQHFSVTMSEMYCSAAQQYFPCSSAVRFPFAWIPPARFGYSLLVSVFGCRPLPWFSYSMFALNFQNVHRQRDRLVRILLINMFCPRSLSCTAAVGISQMFLKSFLPLECVSFNGLPIPQCTSLHIPNS